MWDVSTRLLLALQFTAVVVSGSAPPVALRSVVPSEPQSVGLSNRTTCDPATTQPPNRVDTSIRVTKLIDELKTEGYDAYVITTGDEHQSEYPPSADKRRAYISGFDGSAGTVVVLLDGQRALWADGRYFLQAEDQLDCNWILMKEKQAGVKTIAEFLVSSLPRSAKVSADAKLIGYGEWLALETALDDKGIKMVQSSGNLVDRVWVTDTENKQPLYGTDEAYIHPLQYAGLSIVEKLSDVRSWLSEEGGDALVVTALDEVAWLYNIRGNDVPFNPVVRSYAIVTSTVATLYVDQVKITSNVTDYFGSDVGVSPYSKFFLDLEALATTQSRVILPGDDISPGCSYQVYSKVAEEKRILKTTPTLLMKAQKNKVEIREMRVALIRDAVALVDFLAYLDQEVSTDSSRFTEVSAQELLATYRAEQEDFKDLSFGTISGYGPNGAIIHYGATNLTDATIGTDSLYLLDSGGQYFGGTTDVTRTLHFGTPTEQMMEMYTRVLQGAIDYANLKFPKGTTKSGIEILARRWLYMAGQNYRHGTSHGIGMFLNVHEPVTNELMLGNVASDEPGYYLDGSWGIRIENQVVVVETEFNFDGPFYTFDTLTLVPMEPKLIKIDLLTEDQIDWLNNYNEEIRAKVGVVMQEQGREHGYQWLLNKTEPITTSKTAGAPSHAKMHYLFITVASTMLLTVVIAS